MQDLDKKVFNLAKVIAVCFLVMFSLIGRKYFQSIYEWKVALVVFVIPMGLTSLAVSLLLVWVYDKIMNLLKRRK